MSNPSFSMGLGDLSNPSFPMGFKERHDKGRLYYKQNQAANKEGEK